MFNETTELPFRFDFNVNLQDASFQPTITAEEHEIANRNAPVICIEPGRQEPNIGPLEEYNITENLAICKGKVSSLAAAELLEDTAVQQSDLVRGKYEGGFKLWECAVDLAAYLAHMLGVTSQTFHPSPTDASSALGFRSEAGAPVSNDSGGPVSQSPSTPSSAAKGRPKHRCLELGCGHGIPGIVAILSGAEVHFQDYNKEVIEELTVANVVANQHKLPRELQQPVKFFSGDWSSFSQYCVDHGLSGTYDLILTAETIYDVVASKQLYECIAQCLKPSTGVAYVAAKSYYFGVGGSTAAFREMVDREGCLAVETVKILDDGSSNKREILKLSFKH